MSVRTSHRAWCLVLAVLIACGNARGAPDRLVEGFNKPPQETKPWCYWYWISGNVSKDGITRDLEAMARVGIGAALIGNIHLDEVPAGKTKLLSEEWWDATEHAIREGGRLGIDIGFFNCPGWSQSGGPWIREDQTMRRLVTSETRATGPITLKTPPPDPAGAYQDVAMLAFPAPQGDTERLAKRNPQITCEPAVENAAQLVDGRLDTAMRLPDQSACVIDIQLPEEITARNIQLFPSDLPFSADCELQSKQPDGTMCTIRKFQCDWSNLATAVGFISQAPLTFTFPETRSSHFKLKLTEIKPGHKNFVPSQGASLAEIEISSSAKLEQYIEKQLGKMLPTPFPNWGSYKWPNPTEPENKDLTVLSDQITDLTKLLLPDGNFEWQVPAGEWVIQRIGMIPTGLTNSPAAPEGRGLEVDKMNRKLAREHFDAFAGKLISRMKPHDRRALKYLVADSYEMGAMNWTDGFADAFRKHYGYDPAKWLPSLSGRVVDSAAKSDRFLWDLRRLIADRVGSEYVGGLQEAASSHGLQLWLENYGHWGFPSEFLSYGKHADRVGGEFWVTGELGSIECRAASSCANIYGKRIVSAESYTGGSPFANAPCDLKARGDWSFCEGINHVVLHVYIHQPTEDKKPGVNAPWGTEFNRHNTWFERSRTWMEYQQRCCWMLQQGHHAADVAYYIGEDVPKLTGIRDPALPAGYDFDYINSDALLRLARVENGLLKLPGGCAYRVLVLPPDDTMSPEMIERIDQLVSEGATVLGKPPLRAPGLKSFPDCDKQISTLVTKLWGEKPLPASGRRVTGKGSIAWGISLEQLFKEMSVIPDLSFNQADNLLFTHRTTNEEEIYFVSNQSDKERKIDCSFRVSNRTPELFNPVTGEIMSPGAWTRDEKTTTIPLNFGPHQSWLVVFRKSSAAVPSVASSEQVIQLLDGPWTLNLDTQPELHMNPLTDLSKSDVEDVRCFSGKMLYRTRFQFNESMKGRAIRLDLGTVHDLATIKLNGHELPTLWHAPWRSDVTNVICSGDNELEIEVINVWNNRLVGDARKPEAARTTSLTLQSVTDKTPLQAAGLLGPVNVIAVEKPDR